MALELRRAQSKTEKFAGRPVVYVVSNNPDPKEASNETFQTKKILSKDHGAYWNKWEKRWEWTAFKEGDEDIVIQKATAAVDAANEFLQNKAEKIAPIIKALKDIEEGIAQAPQYITKTESEDVIGKIKAFIRDLQQEVDDVRFDQKISEYFEFMASSRGYSMRNMLLIWIQDRTAKDVRSKTNWGLVGRKPKENAKRIILFRPRLRKQSKFELKQTEEKFRKSRGYGPSDRLSKEDYIKLQQLLKNGVPISFDWDKLVAYPTYNVTETEPIDPNSDEEVPGLGDIKWSEEDQPSERADKVRDAAVAAAEGVGIKVSFMDEKEMGGAKGWSQGGKIVLSDSLNGVGGLSVAAHEFAHEILHQTFLKATSKEKQSDSEEDFINLYVGRDETKIRELQAEATAYVIIRNYGFHTEASANYIALFRNDRKNIEKNLEIITKTSNKLIKLIDRQLGGADLNETQMNEDLNMQQVAQMLGIKLGKPDELEESTDFDRYEEVVFMQGEEAQEVLDIIDQHGEEAGLKHLMQWHDPGNHMGTSQVPHGSSDYLYQKDGYTMSYNPSLGYVGLIYDMQHDGLKHQMHSMGEIPLNEAVRAEVRMALAAPLLEGKYDYEVYHETLSGALDELRRYLALKGYEVDEDDMFTQFGTGGITYGQTKRASLGLKRDGEPAKNLIHVQIYRMDSGRYELNMYYNSSRSIKEYSDRNVEDYPWYCQECDEEKQWFDVTYEETCAQCGSEVVPNEEAQDYTDMAPEDYSDMMMEIQEGLWDNIHAKRKRGEKPAKPGDKDYPDTKAWKKAQQSENSDLEYQYQKPTEKNHGHTVLKHQGQQIGYMMPIRSDAAEVGHNWFVDITVNGLRSTDHCTSRSQCIKFAKNVLAGKHEELTQEEWEEANAILEKADGWEECKPSLDEAEYQGRKVKLNKPMRGDVKKFKVYVKNDKGNVVKVNFGQKGVKIKKNNPKKRKSFRARHGCDNPGPKWKAKYWSCKKW